MGLDIAAERKRIADKEQRKTEKDRQREEARKEHETIMTKLRAEEQDRKLKTGLICSQCGHLGKPKLITKGNIVSEAALWIFGVAFCWFFLVSLIFPIGYSMWRHLSRFNGCPQCGGTMIKTSSPVGLKMVADIHQK